MLDFCLMHVQCAVFEERCPRQEVPRFFLFPSHTVRASCLMGTLAFCLVYVQQAVDRIRNVLVSYVSYACKYYEHAGFFRGMVSAAFNIPGRSLN